VHTRFKDSKVPVSDDAASETRRARSIAYGKLCVLVVEDEGEVRLRLEAILSAADFDVFAVASAGEAREAMEALVFPLVIIDRMLGQEDGIELVGELRRRYAEHRVFLMLYSALDSPEERCRGLAVGADAYVSKRASNELLMKELLEARSKIRLTKAR
jgi:DNA-binding response OmpR family regulator